MARRFYWKRGNYESHLAGVGHTARAVIADYIEKNKNKSAEQLRSDLEIRKHDTNTWATSGGHPFTLVEHATIKNNFPKIIRLNGGEKIRISRQWGFGGDPNDKWGKLIAIMNNLGYTILAEDEKVPSPPVENRNLGSQKTSREVSREVSLLQQFKQIILYGPPGTGKTFRAKTEILPQLLGVDKDEVDDEQGGRWDIVQFHPSYNYEDFVRGVKVETAGNNVAYKTENRTFGDICERAEDDPDNDYVLIIDEINRANVSAVLGELIYALEYRGKKIKTPYTIDGADDSMLVIPENLYVIGTMNTADRTIGQIDYAVRRRFAFVHCPPDKSVIKKGNALDVFSEVDAIFDDDTSPDYDAADVRIGHSYFLAEGGELARKIIYQVVPILREYVKDGVLTKEAELKITEIENKFINEAKKKDELKKKSDTESTKEDIKGHSFFYWEKDGRFRINSVERTVLSIVHDYVDNNKVTLNELQEWFPDSGKDDKNRGIKSDIDASNKECFFTEEADRLNVKGQTAYVTNQWGMGKKWGFNGNHPSGTPGAIEDFIKEVEAHGYNARICYIVKVEDEGKKRGWEECKKFNFVSASGVSPQGRSYTKMLRTLKKKDILFVFLMGADGKKGFVAMGEVVEKAVKTKEFKVKGTPILDCVCSDGQKYRDKYPLAAEHANDEKQCDWMVQVKWKTPPLSREEIEGTTVRQHVTYLVVSRDNLKIIKRKFEKAE